MGARQSDASMLSIFTSWSIRERLLPQPLHPPRGAFECEGCHRENRSTAGDIANDFRYFFAPERITREFFGMNPARFKRLFIGHRLRRRLIGRFGQKKHAATGCAIGHGRMFDPEQPFELHANTAFFERFANRPFFDGFTRFHPTPGDIPQLPVFSFVHEEKAITFAHNHHSEEPRRNGITSAHDATVTDFRAG